ncbi:CoA transferase [Rubrobacter taiwanensis]|jgi:crotonobetainyl-CoA:carnitine CoA-transferase CaiB-like acyl-CoA transferase|uniref:CoA transferase n=1 Tax=Rubrobacter taiwanensis TaxID=185139 RepID=A0A4R1BQB0_9ACTN|nr:CoA transferase [Rubrobacter taiwanensis]TCJ19874.1 CoA transferase [Rubrobacter taiwanensis]
MERNSGPLSGVKVIDLSRALAGPYATMMLADAGAEVIKVERPGKGDDSRGWGPPFVGGPGAEESTYFLSVNRSKKSVVLDFKDPKDLQELKELICGADVLVENFRPGVMERIGLGEAELEALNPRLVVLSITGFGEGGPEGHKPGFDQIVQGEAGLMSITGLPDGPPIKVGVPIADILAGMFGAFGVSSALMERERSGRGQRVQTSLLASVVAIHTFQGTRWLVAGEVPERTGNRHPTIAPYGAYECADGVINIAVGSEGIWQRFAPLVGLDPNDERFATNGDRVRGVKELEEAMAPALKSAGVDEWMERLGEAGVPAGRVRTLDQVYASPQLEHLKLIDEVDHPTLGRIRLPGSPLQYGRSGRRAASAPPLLGQHTEEELGRLAGGTESKKTT